MDAGADILALYPDAVPSILQALDSDDPEVVLGEYAHPVLLAALEDPEANVAQTEKLVEVLGRTPTDRVLEAIRLAAASEMVSLSLPGHGVLLWTGKEEYTV